MKIKRILCFFIILLIWNKTVFAKYTYTFEENIINLKRNSDAPICKVSYSEENWTNKSVIVTIEANKQVENVSGFTLSEDRKKLVREVFENEEKIVKICDIDGNMKEVMYSVQNIDKQEPKIINCENNEIYEAPKKIEFEDNGEIEKVNVEKYSENLLVEYNSIYYDQAYYFGIDRTSSTIEVKVCQKPLGTKKYKYYINNKLYKKTEEEEYIFTGLEKGTEYEVMVEAISEEEDILDTEIINARTGYFKHINSEKTEKSFSAKLEKIDNSVANIKYAYWNAFDVSNVVWAESEIIDKNAQIKFQKYESEVYPVYIVHAYMYDKNGEILDIVEFSIDFATDYIEPETEINTLTEPGNYKIEVSDYAGNTKKCNIKLIKIE